MSTKGTRIVIKKVDGEWQAVWMTGNKRDEGKTHFTLGGDADSRADAVATALGMAKRSGGGIPVMDGGKNINFHGALRGFSPPRGRVLALLAVAGLGLVLWSRRARAATQQPPTDPGFATEPAADARHVVKSGDSLSSVAQTHYRDQTLWPLIFDASRPANPMFTSPDNVLLGMTFLVPSLAGSSSAALADARRRAAEHKAVWAAHIASGARGFPVLPASVLTPRVALR